MLAQPSWRRASGVWLEAFIVKGKGPEDKCWCLPRRSKFFFSLKEFFPLKQDWMWAKFTRIDLICAVWHISIIRLKYKDNNKRLKNRKQRKCGRRRWRWQEVASYLRLQPILWPGFICQSHKQTSFMCEDKTDDHHLHPLPPHRLPRVRWAVITIGSISWWLE